MAGDPRDAGVLDEPREFPDRQVREFGGLYK